jgi:hypothetical protein
MNPHSKANYIPEDYEFVSVLFQGRAVGEDYAAVVEAWLEESSSEEYVRGEELLETVPVDGNHKAKGTCDHCGAWFKFGGVLLHKPTGRAIAVGRTCLFRDFGGIGGTMTRAEFDFRRLEELAKRARERAKAKAAAEARIAELGLEEDLDVDHYIIRDIKQRAFRYGKLSDNQANLVRKLAREVRDRAAERATEPAPAPVVEGKGVQVEGKLLTVREEESQFGSPYHANYTYKMLVLDDRGFRVWGTCPESLFEAFHGNTDDLGSLQYMQRHKPRVRFVANLEASRKDKCFGFFKRPRKAEVLNHA